MGEGSERLERDTMGEMRVPAAAYYGAQTQRAVLNFPISGQRFPRAFIASMGLLKWAAAKVNAQRGVLTADLADAVLEAADEVIEGRLDDHFVVDIYQTGSGTSTNMNANEVIANRANQRLGHALGEKGPVHPNDHVNAGQSSNDVIPSAIHLAALSVLSSDLRPALDNLATQLEGKAAAFDDVLKLGRTHLQDATPVRLGQEFSGWAMQVRRGIERIDDASQRLCELALGGTAVGTGLNAPPGFAAAVIGRLAQRTGLPLVEAANHFEAQGGKDAAVEMSGALRVVAVSLYKIANDLRFLASGPRGGYGEITLPELQPGSSIMPGKVNPVIPEVVMQVAARVIGNDAAIGVGGLSGNFELNVMMPLIASSLLESITLLAKASQAFATRCVAGIEANREQCAASVEQSLAMCTSLAPRIGYEAAAAIAKEAYASGRTVREVAREQALLPDEELDALLDPLSMT